MGMDIVTRRPARCHLVNVATGESIECLLNPKGFTEKVQVQWNRISVPGLSYQPLQYQSTGNREVRDLEFYLDRFYAAEQPGDGDILGFRRFLRTLTLPVPGQFPAAPPRTLLVWPQVLTLEGVVTELTFSYQQFASDGSVLVYTAQVALDEACGRPRRVD